MCVWACGCAVCAVVWVCGRCAGAWVWLRAWVSVWVYYYYPKLFPEHSFLFFFFEFLLLVLLKLETKNCAPREVWEPYFLNFWNLLNFWKNQKKSEILKINPKYHLHPRPQPHPRSRTPAHRILTPPTHNAHRRHTHTHTHARNHNFFMFFQHFFFVDFFSIF